MDSKKLRKSILRFVGWLGLILCSLIIQFMPVRLLYGFAKNIASLGYLFAGKQRKIALDSLGIAFGKEKSEQEIKQIAKNCFIFMAKAGVELLFLINRPRLLRERVELEGKENLDLALSKGRGVILVSAHFGNFALFLCKLSLEGYPIAAIMRYMRDERAERFFARRRQKLNIKTIYTQPRNVCVKTTIKALYNNEVIFVPLDQNFGTGGIFVDFFGRKAATATGPIVLALRTKATVIPCFIVRQKDDSHRIVFEKPLDLAEGNGSSKVITDSIQKLTNIIESYIRRYPAEWGWIHRRWKSRPN